MAIVIPLEVKGDGDFNSAMRGMQGAAKDFKDSWVDLKKNLRGGVPSGGSAGGSGGGGGGGGGLRPVANGPAQQLRKAWLDLHKAQFSGDDAQIFDANLNHAKAVNRMNRAQKYGQQKGWMDQAKDAFMTSRFSMGGQGGNMIMPLVNRVLPLLGKAGPIGMVLAVIGKVGHELVQAMQALSKHFQALSGARYAAGASHGQVGQMFGLGEAIGTDAAGVAQIAREFSRTISGGGYAAGVWRQFGVSDAPGPYGRINKFDNLKAAVDVLMKLPEKEAIRLARESGLEQFLPLRDADKGRVNALMDESAALSTPKAAKEAANFNVEMARLKVAFQSLLPYLTPIIEFFTALIERVRFLLAPLRAVMAAFAWIEGWIVRIWKAIEKAIRLDFKGAVDELRGGAKSDAEKASKDRNTEAINENTRELRAQREIIGGGPRANAALPQAARYQFINNQLDSLSNIIGGL